MHLTALQTSSGPLAAARTRIETRTAAEAIAAGSAAAVMAAWRTCGKANRMAASALGAAAERTGKKIARKAVRRTLECCVAGVAGRSLARSLTRESLPAAGRCCARAIVRSEILGAAAGIIVDQGIDRLNLAAGSIDRLEYQLRTGENLGSAIGGLAGTGVGAALGSAVYPGVGTSVGAFVGGYLGGLGGSAAGRAIASRLNAREAEVGPNLVVLRIDATSTGEAATGFHPALELDGLVQLVG